MTRALSRALSRWRLATLLAHALGVGRAWRVWRALVFYRRFLLLKEACARKALAEVAALRDLATSELEKMAKLLERPQVCISLTFCVMFHFTFMKLLFNAKICLSI